MAIKAKVVKGFHYVKVYSVLEVRLGIAPAAMTHHDAKKGDVMEFEDRSAFEEMEEVAAQGERWEIPMQTTTIQ